MNGNSHIRPMSSLLSAWHIKALHKQKNAYIPVRSSVWDLCQAASLMARLVLMKGGSIYWTCSSALLNSRLLTLPRAPLATARYSSSHTLSKFSCAPVDTGFCVIGDDVTVVSFFSYCKGRVSSLAAQQQLEPRNLGIQQNLQCYELALCS